MPAEYPSTDAELKTRVRDLTSYDNTPDELPDTQLDSIVESAKGRLELETGTDAWYTDDGITFALVAYTCMRAKAAVENVPLSGYSIGDERVEFENEEPEDSAQYQQWAEDVRVGLDASDKDSSSGATPTNTSAYIGETYIGQPPHDRDRL